MANFTRVKPLGYGKNEILTSKEATELDIDHAKSVNGDDGGQYAGTLTWTGEHTFADVLRFAGDKAGWIPRVKVWKLGALDVTADVWVLPKNPGQNTQLSVANAPSSEARVLIVWRPAFGSFVVGLRRSNQSQILTFGSGQASAQGALLLWVDGAWHTALVNGLAPGTQAT